MLAAGQLSSLKASIVNNVVLQKLCHDHLELTDLILRVPSPEEHEGEECEGLKTMQAAAVEALIGAIYLDRGIESALEFTNEHILPAAFRVTKETSRGQLDPIGHFMNMMQKKYPNAIAKDGGVVYDASENTSIPNSNIQSFTVNCYVQGKVRHAVPFCTSLSCHFLPLQLIFPFVVGSFCQGQLDTHC
jgi:dsRNA-specific ribonuclease